jgi:hypothetical protein
MPDVIDKDLRDCLERPNPYTSYRIEIAEPDVGQVLRRQDQFLQCSDARVAVARQLARRFGSRCG